MTDNGELIRNPYPFGEGSSSVQLPPNVVAGWYGSMWS